MDFIVVDIELANNKPAGICEIGVVRVENMQIKEKVGYLVKPNQLDFDPYMAQVHSITLNDIEDAPTFDVVWSKIKHFFKPDTLCVAHNSQFDFGYIKSALEFYNIPYENYPIGCSYQYARHSDNLFVENLKLGTLCEYFGVVNEKAHSALSDATANAEVMIKMIEQNNDNLLQLLERCNAKSFVENVCTPQLRRKYDIPSYHKVHAKDVEATNSVFDSTHPIYNKRIVLTGSLNSMSREQAYLEIKNLGGIAADTLTKKTDYLVTRGSRVTHKISRALELQQNGSDIKIINEIDFLRLLAGTPIAHNSTSFVRANMIGEMEA